MPGINILSIIGQAIIKSIVSMFVSFLFQSLIQAVFGVRGGDFNFKAFEQIIRSPVAPTRIIYGQKLVAGPLMFVESTDGDKFLHLVVAHAAHECHDFTDLYVADQRVPPRDMNGDEVNATDFAGFVRRTIHLGSPNQAADSNLVADVGIWTTDHRLRGICYGRYRLKANEVVFRELEQPPRVEVIGLQAVPSTNTVGVKEVRINEPRTGKGEPFIPFPSGIPNLRILIRGRKVWDPRDTGLAIASSSFLTAGQVEIETVSDHGKSVGDTIFIAGHAQEQENVIFGEYVVEAVGDGRLLTIGQVTDTITGVGTGGTLYDMKFHHNPVLCILDYLVNKSFGRASPESFLNLTQIIAAANTCDEQVVLTTRGNFFTADFANNLLSRTDPSFPINTGSSVQLTTNNTLPAPLAVETEYFYVHRGNLTEFGLATSYVNAVRGVFITITDNGTGTHAVTRFSQPRYTCNGAFTTDAAPINIMEDLLTSCAGNLVNVAGKFHINVGAPAAVTFTMETSHQRGEIVIEADSDRRGKFNRVSGVFVSPDNFWQASDFPPVKRDQFIEDDGLELNRDIELRFTNDQVEAQRIATIHLLCSRFAISTNVLVNLHPMTVAPWDVIAFNNSALSWAVKEFRVLGWAMVPDGKSLGLMMDMIEYDSNCYVWDLSEAQLVIPPPLPDINSPAEAPEPILDPDGGRGECTVNGLIDTFSDENGIDQALSSGISYDAARDLYTGGAIWVVIDFDGEIVTSPDAINWTQQTNPNQGVPFAAVRGLTTDRKGNWVIAATVGRILTSPDAVNWTLRFLNETDFFCKHAIFYPDDEVFIVTTDDPDSTPDEFESRIHRSADGISWTTSKAFPNGPTADAFTAAGLAHDGFGVIMAAGQGDTSLQAKIARSSDGGFTWTDVADVIHNRSFSRIESDQGATTGGPITVAGGSDDGTEPEKHIWTSGDGSNWTLQTDHPFTSIITALAYGNDLWLGGDLGIRIAKSLDGQHWNLVTPTPFTNVIRDFHWSEEQQQWVAVGNDSQIATSPDGITWTLQTVPISGATFMQVKNGPANMVLVSAGQCPARFVPSFATIFVVEKDIDAVELGVDLKISASRDDGTTFTEGTIEDVGNLDLSSGRRILKAVVLLTGQPAGSAMRWKIETLNVKSVEIHSVEMFWSR